MKLLRLNNISKFYFGCDDIAKALDISADSAKVTASRYAKQGILVRVKRNMYVLHDRWKVAGREEKFVIANLGQVPSYISLMSALDYYEITTQIQRDFFESVAIKRTKETHVDGSVFRYVKINSTLYFGFNKEKDFFIATPEKALVDAFYLMSYGRYALDISALSAKNLIEKRFGASAEIFP
jgi:predicted transcriptional regulator of viral defense system